MGKLCVEKRWNGRACDRPALRELEICRYHSVWRRVVGTAGAVDVGSKLVLLVSGIVFLAGVTHDWWTKEERLAAERERQRAEDVDGAWATIYRATNQGGNGGRKDALEFLSREEIPLSGVNVSRAYLEQAELTGAIFFEADLSGAVLPEAVLDEAFLLRANLEGAHLTDARLIEADLTQATLSNADLEDADLTGADLSDAKLMLADLTGANLTDAVFTVADLTQAGLDGANLTGAHLRNATLDRISIEDPAAFRAALDRAHCWSPGTWTSLSPSLRVGLEPDRPHEWNEQPRSGEDLSYRDAPEWKALCDAARADPEDFRLRSQDLGR